MPVYRRVQFDFVPIPRERLLGTVPLAAEPAEGQPSPVGMQASSPDFVPRDWAVFLLRAAAEVEHALMIQYLYAAYSIRSDAVVPPGVDLPTMQQEIVAIAKEEMGHLLTVQNLLRAIGGPVTVERQDFPLRTAFYPFPFVLEPLTKGSLAKYVFAEMSAGEIPPEILTTKERETISDEARIAAGGHGSFVNHVGAIYSSLAELFEHTLKEDDFRPDRKDWQSSGWGKTNSGTTNIFGIKLIPVCDRKTALQAIDIIARQGEVASEEGSHFTRFLKIYREWPADSTAWTWPVSKNPTTDPDAPDSTLLTNPTTTLWAYLFNLRYRVLLTFLLHYVTIAGTETDAAQDPSKRKPVRDYLRSWIYEEMKGGGSLHELAVSRMVQQPGATNPTPTAGPTFGLPYSLLMPDLNPERWRLHLDLIGATQQVIARINLPNDALLRSIRQRDDIRRTAIETLMKS